MRFPIQPTNKLLHTGALQRERTITNTGWQRMLRTGTRPPKQIITSTSRLRDDYRQELANGNKAAPDSSYHGGSRRGGYGHGLAADLVSVKGDTRAERCMWSDILWKWIDAHEKELGIGRPYLDKDPPHVAPIDGKEYADKRNTATARLAGLKKPSPSSNPK